MGCMSTRKKSSNDIERQLISDADDPQAWGKPVQVPPSRSPRPERILCHNAVPHLIGDIAITFGTLEFYLEAAIWQMVAQGDQERQQLGEAITAEMAFDRKVHAFHSIFALRFPAEGND